MAAVYESRQHASMSINVNYGPVCSTVTSGCLLSSALHLFKANRDGMQEEICVVRSAIILKDGTDILEQFASSTVLFVTRIIEFANPQHHLNSTLKDVQVL